MPSPLGERCFGHGEPGALPLNLPSGLLRRFGVGDAEAMRPRSPESRLLRTARV